MFLYTYGFKLCSNGLQFRSVITEADIVGQHNGKYHLNSGNMFKAGTIHSQCDVTPGTITVWMDEKMNTPNSYSTNCEVVSLPTRILTKENFK